MPSAQHANRIRSLYEVYIRSTRTHSLHTHPSKRTPWITPWISLEPSVWGSDDVPVHTECVLLTLFYNDVPVHPRSSPGTRGRASSGLKTGRGHTYGICGGFI